MSFVNKASKNNVLYDLQDSRIYTLDLGDVSSIMQDGHFQKVVNADDIVALAQATEGSITFTMNGMPAICKVIAKGTYTDGGQTITQVVASLFMQQQENEYTTYSVMAIASGNVAQVSGTQIKQSISSGGGSGATIIEKTLSNWQTDSGSGQQMASFSIDSTDLNNAINNDNLILKLIDNDMGGNWTLQKVMTQSNMVFFAQLTEDKVFMAIMMEEDDGSYQGMAVMMPYEQAFGSKTLKLYTHEIEVEFDGASYGKFVIVTTSASQYTQFVDIQSVINSNNFVVGKYGISSSPSSYSRILGGDGTHICTLDANSGAIGTIGIGSTQTISYDNVSDYPVK